MGSQASSGRPSDSTKHPFRFARMHGEIEWGLDASRAAFRQLRADEFMRAYSTMTSLEGEISRDARWIPVPAFP